VNRRPAILAAAAAATLTLPCAAQAATKTVDMGTPLPVQKQLNSKYSADVNAFFPNGITIHAGDSVKFVPTGFHNVDFPAKGKKAAELLATQGPVSGVLDAAGAPFWFNGKVANVGFNPAVITGSLGKKVTYSASKGVQSGLPLSDKPKPMTVKFPKTGKYTYYCDVHPGMKGTVTVAATSKSIPSAADDQKALAEQVKTVTATVKKVAKPSLPANTITIGSAGAGGAEVFKFLPETLTVPVGATVKFIMDPQSLEVHTATSGPGNPENQPSSYLGKLAASLESPTIDPAAAYPSDPPPAGPAKLTPALHGNGFWNSGVLDALKASALPAENSVTFSAAGTYTFYCLVHPFMRGTVVAQ
jgi:plastocyanin